MSRTDQWEKTKQSKQGFTRIDEATTGKSEGVKKMVKEDTEERSSREKKKKKKKIKRSVLKRYFSTNNSNTK